MVKLGDNILPVVNQFSFNRAVLIYPTWLSSLLAHPALTCTQRHTFPHVRTRALEQGHTGELERDLKTFCQCFFWVKNEI